MSLPPSDFCLTLTCDGAVCHATLTDYDNGIELASETVESFEPARVQSEYLIPLAAYAEQAFPRADLERLGAELARLLLPPRIRRILLSHLWDSPTARIRLFVATPERMAALPWEYTFLEINGQTQFIGLHPRMHLIRQQTAPQAIKAPPALPIRVLIAWANPASDKYHYLPHIQEELHSLETALKSTAPGSIQIKTLASATSGGMEQAIREERPHIIHFAGHGDARPTGGVLILQGGSAGSEDRLYAEELAKWLRQTECRLVVLSACHTASPVRGLAAMLSAAGVPAVIGMQLPMRSAISPSFTREFYGALAAGVSVEAALSQFRQVYAHTGPDWGVPVLHLAGKSGDLFSFTPSQTQPSRAPLIRLPYPSSPHFLGRGNAMIELHGKMQTANRRVALTGLGGLGKTQLANEYAHRFREAYPGGVFWIHARDTQRVKDEYVALSRLFEMPESLSPEDRAQRMRSQLQTLAQPALLIYDNLTPDTDVEWLPAMGLCHVLVTTRLPYLVNQTFQIFPVQALNREDALALLRDTGREPVDAPDQSDMEEIAALLGGLPLALSLVANHVRRLRSRYGDYLTRLKAQPHKMLAQARARFHTATQHDGVLFDALEITCSDLSPEALAVFGTAACFAGRGISPELLQTALTAPVSSLEPDDFLEALAELEDYCLLTREADDRLTMHELVRVFARGRMETEARRQAIENVTGVLKDCLEQANEAMNWNETRRELVHCRTAEELCRAHECPPSTYQLQRELGHYYIQHGEYAAAEAALSSSLELVSARHGRTHIETAVVLCKLGEAKQRRGEDEGARVRMEEALTIALTILNPDDPELANYYNDAGVILKMQGETDQAAAYYHQALGIYEKAFGHEHPKTAQCLNNLGALFEVQGQLDKAREHVQQALSIDETVFGPNSPKVAIRLNNLGRILTQQADDQQAQALYQQALSHHQRALKINEATYGPQNPNGAASLYYAANAETGLGRIDEAMAHYQQALVIYERYFGAEDYRCDNVRQASATAAFQQTKEKP